MDGDERGGTPRMVAGLAGVLVLWLVAMLVGTLVAGLAFGPEGDDQASPSSIAGQDIVPTLFGLVVTAAVLTRRRWWRTALTDPVPTRSWVWVVPAVVAVGALVTTDWGRLGSAGAALVVWLVLGVLAVALSEELLFRGLVLTTLRQHLGEVAAAGWTVVLFAVMHSVADLQLNPLQLVSTATGGVVYYLTKRVAGSIWPAVAIHALVDFSLYSITLGPGETADNRAPAILLALVLGSLVALVGVRWIAPRRRPASPQRRGPAAT